MGEKFLDGRQSHRQVKIGHNVNSIEKLGESNNDGHQKQDAELENPPGWKHTTKNKVAFKPGVILQHRPTDVSKTMADKDTVCSPPQMLNWATVAKGSASSSLIPGIAPFPPSGTVTRPQSHASRYIDLEPAPLPPPGSLVWVAPESMVGDVPLATEVTANTAKNVQESWRPGSP